MKIEYERACKEAGMPEEQIKEIRRMFDADYKRWKWEKKVKEDAGYVYYSLELLKNPEGGVCYYDIPDPAMDVEQMMLHKLDLEKLGEVLSRISEEERQFILDCFEAEWGARKEVAEKYGMTVGAVKQRKRRICKDKDGYRKVYNREAEDGSEGYRQDEEYTCQEHSSRADNFGSGEKGVQYLHGILYTEYGSGDGLLKKEVDRCGL